MQDISIHISKLLFSNPKVIVNGLGYFIATEAKAYHHPVSHDFTPKNKKISFYVDKEIKGTLLVDSLNVDSADKLIESFSKKVIAEIHASKQVVLPNLGVIIKHEKGNVFFKQDENIVFDFDFFGMEGLNQKPLATAKVTASKTPIIINEIKKDTVNTQKKELKAEVTPKIAKKEDEKESSNMWLWVAIAGLVAILIIGFVFIDNDKESGATAENIAVNKVNDAENADEVTQEAAKIEEDDSVETDSDVNTEAEVVASNDNNTTIAADVAVNAYYYVMAGCFSSSANAENYLKELKSGDFPNAEIKGVTKSGLIRVCYNKFETEDEAEIFMMEVSKKENKELWLQLIEN